MRNVVLLCLDSVRKDYFDKFARRLTERADVVYDQCRAASGWSIPSHASMFTGELPHVHGVHSHARDFSQIEAATNFLGDLEAHTRIGVSANTYASQNYGFDSFFDVFTQVSNTATFQFESARSPTDPDLSGVSYVDYLARALRDPRPVRSLLNGVSTKFNPYDILFTGRPWPEIRDKGTKKALSDAQYQITATECDDCPVFSFLNLMDAHVPMYHHRGLNRELHTVPNSWTSKSGPTARSVSHHSEEYRDFIEKYTQLYAASIDYLDRQVDAWIDAIQRTTSNQTTVVITADHGENLGTPADEFQFEHHSSLSEAILHVPLVLINPPEGYPETSSTIVSQLELGDLLVNLAHEEVFTVGNEPVIAEVIGHTGEDPGGAYWDRMIRCVYEGSRKLTWDSLGSTKLFEIDFDTPSSQSMIDDGIDGFPDEDSTLFSLDILAAKREAVERSLHTGEPQLDTLRAKQLAALGYR